MESELPNRGMMLKTNTFLIVEIHTDRMHYEHPTGAIPFTNLLGFSLSQFYA